MIISSFSITDAGGRQPNEDACAMFENEKSGAWAVCDGLGGHIDGEVASAQAVKEFMSPENGNFSLDDDFFKNQFSKINADIHQLNGPLTTAVFAVRSENKFRFANVGDSRLYFFRKGKILTRTDDHSMAFVSYKLGEIPYEEIRFSPVQNRLLKALGSTDKIQAQLYDPLSLEEGDAFLMCTDGFWELVYEPEMIETLKKSKNAENWISQMLKKLKNRFSENSDNYTAMAGIVKKLN